MKTRKLVEEDRRALDLLLDSSAAAHVNTGGSVTRVSRVVHPSRLDAAQRLLATLESMPEVEVPMDLVARTMARIDASNLESASLPESVRATMHLPPA